MECHDISTSFKSRMGKGRFFWGGGGGGAWGEGVWRLVGVQHLHENGT